MAGTIQMGRMRWLFVRASESLESGPVESPGFFRGEDALSIGFLRALGFSLITNASA
jgi:hypothetical protein